MSQRMIFHCLYHVITCALISITALGVTPSVFAQPCDASQPLSGEVRPCRYHADIADVIDVGTSFRYWVRLGLGGQPVGDASLPSVEIEVITPTGVRVCSGVYIEQSVQKSILSVELDARMQCNDGGTLRDHFARHPTLAVRLCPQRGNCLRPVQLGAVPYAIKAQFASWVQRASVAEQAAVAEYAHRIIANRADLLRNSISRGYLSLTQRTVGTDVLASLLWSPTLSPGDSLHITAKDHRIDRITWLHSIVLAALESVIQGKLWVRGFDEDGDRHEEGLSVAGDSSISSHLQVHADVDSASVLLEGVAFLGLWLYSELSVTQTSVTSEVAGQARLGYSDSLPASARGLTLSGDLAANATATLTGRLRLSSDGVVYGASDVRGSLLQPEGSLSEPQSASVSATRLDVGTQALPSAATLGGGVSATQLNLPARDPAVVVAGPRLTHRGVTYAANLETSSVKTGAPVRDLLELEDNAVRLGSAGEPVIFQGPTRFKRPVTLPNPERVTVTYDGCVFEDLGEGDGGRLKVRLRCAGQPPLDLNVFTCGDGIIDLGEQCDDGNLISDDKCTDHCLCNCTFGEPGCFCRSDTCGDNVVDEGKEDCDDGNFTVTDACINCNDARCGDGYVRGDANPEGCDDGNTDGGDGCSALCTIEAGFACALVEARSVCCQGANPANLDGDAECDDQDLDDDNDGFSDLDEETCDSDPRDANSRPLDTDDDGLCDDGVDEDDDGDGRNDDIDSAPLNPLVCADTDGDSCDDCNSGVFDPDNDEVDPDGNPVCVGGNAQDRDGDGFSNADEVTCGSNPNRRNRVPQDTDGDGLCDNGVDPDDDDDGRADEVDSAPLNDLICADTDGDQCDDCSSGTFNPQGDGLDTDGDGACDLGDADDDGDGRDDQVDSAPLNPLICADTDGDQCEDCSSGNFNPQGDGLDTDGDGACDLGDADDDGDGRDDGVDSAPLNRLICADTDGDDCDDCNSGTFDPQDDGLDTDEDGACNLSDTDDDGDGRDDGVDSAPLNSLICADTDGDDCDDCSSGTFNPQDDGLDTDGDGACDLGDADDDGDGRDDGVDSAPLNPLICADTDGDGCDDCSSGVFDPTNDGVDPDGNQVCQGGDAQDRDGDGFSDDDEVTCGSNPNGRNQTPLDTDSDGLCDNGVDSDDDNDGIADDVDVDLNGDDASLDPSKCIDEDADGCDDCSSTLNNDFAAGANHDPAGDGLDTDSDGACNLSDVDDDGDSFHDRYEELCEADPLSDLSTPNDDLNGLCAQVHFAPQADPADAPAHDVDNDGYRDTYEIACGADPDELAATTPTPNAGRVICPLLDLL